MREELTRETVRLLRIEEVGQRLQEILLAGLPEVFPEGVNRQAAAVCEVHAQALAAELVDGMQERAPRGSEIPSSEISYDSRREAFLNSLTPQGRAIVSDLSWRLFDSRNGARDLDYCVKVDLYGAIDVLVDDRIAGTTKGRDLLCAPLP